MTGRVAAVRNRLLVAVGAVLLAWLFGWTSDEGLLMLLVAVVALALAVMRGLFGGLGVLGHWLFRYRRVGIGLAELGDIIGEHRDDMRRAGLVVSQRRPLMWRRWHKQQLRQRPLPDLLPRLRHRPYDGGIRVTLEAVRAGMSQEEILRALPRLRSAWGVDQVRAVAKPGGRVVEVTIPFTDRARAELDLDDGVPREPEPVRRREPVAAPARGERPPDAPPVQVVQGSASEPRTEAFAARARPPRIRPQLEPDERGHYDLEMLPIDAARTFAPRSPDDMSRALPVTAAADDEPPPSTDEMPVIAPPTRVPTSVPTSVAVRDTARPARRSPDEPTPNPTHIDERDLRLGPHWRTGKER